LPNKIYEWDFISQEIVAGIGNSALNKLKLKRGYEQLERLVPFTPY